MSGTEETVDSASPENDETQGEELDDSVAEPRGDNGQEGHWLTLDEALAETLGQEAWWEIAELKGRRVEVKQHDPNGPIDKPIFRWSNGDMYLGSWGASQDPQKPWPVEEGFGVFYFNYPNAIRGRLNICENIQQGFLNGYGKELWLDDAPSWKRNSINRNFPHIRKSMEGRDGYRPFIYEGKFRMDQKHDRKGKVILKNGICRVGPWENDKHVGKWISHQLVDVFNPFEQRIEPRKEPEKATEEDSSVELEHSKKRKLSSRSKSKKSKRRKDRRGTSKERHSGKEDSADALLHTQSEDKTTDETVKEEVNDVVDSSKNDDPPNQPTVSESVAEDSAPKVITLSNSQVSSGPDHEDLMDDPQILQMITRVRDWLCTDEAIGFGAAPKEMERYAEHFFREGLHSPEMIVALCQAPQYFSNFRWMKHSHKQAYQFHRELKDGKKESTENE